MNLLISDHRLSKLETYNKSWIKSEILNKLTELSKNQFIMGYSGMADGVDLWFCQSCAFLGFQYVACIPFDEQDEYMTDEWKNVRKDLIKDAAKIIKCKNSVMVEKADFGMVVWDGNKGGTHNVFQQLLEKRRPFYWLNPISQKTFLID